MIIKKNITILILSIMYIFASLIIDTGSFGEVNSKKIDINDIETQMSMLSKNGIDYYESINLDKLGLVVSYNSKYKGYQILDYENWKLYCFKYDSNFYSVTDIDKKIISENTSYDNIQYEFYLNYGKIYLKNCTQPVVSDNKKTYISSEFLNKQLGVVITKTDNLIKFNRPNSYSSFSDFYSDMLYEFDDSYEQNRFESAYKNLDYEEYKEHKISKFIAYIANSKYAVDNQFEIINKVIEYKKMVQKSFWISDLVFKKEQLVNATNNQPFYGEIKRYSNVKIIDINVVKESFVISLNGKGKYLLKFEYFEMYKNLQDDYPYCLLTIDPKKKFKWSTKIWAYVEKCDCWIGMTPEMAYMTMGKPEEINTTAGSWGKIEQWVYEGSNYNNTYLYFKNGKLVSWQD